MTVDPTVSVKTTPDAAGSHKALILLDYYYGYGAKRKPLRVAERVVWDVFYMCPQKDRKTWMAVVDYLDYWLVLSNMFYCPFSIWDNHHPIDFHAFHG